MGFCKRLVPLLIVAPAFCALAACGGNGAVPNGAPGGANAASQFSSFDSSVATPAKSGSVLKKLKKDVVIGTTTDPTNGDTGARGLTIVKSNYGELKSGELAYCDFENKSGTAGQGTTIDLMGAKTGSSPSTFAENSDIEGCDDVAISDGDAVYGAGATSGDVEEFSENGKATKTYGSPIEVPFADADAFCHEAYRPENIFVGDSKDGNIVKFGINVYGSPKELQIISGFAVGKGSGWSVLGPSGLQYDGCKDTLYIVDGADNTIVSVQHVSALLEKDEIVVKKGGKTFDCKYPHTSCATLVYSGKPLDAPVASALLPNGNLIVANTQGGNTLVELSSAGKVLDTKVVDKSSTAGIFGLVAAGSSSDTTLFFTDTNTNNLQELEP
jgi:hypothetical protein